MQLLERLRSVPRPGGRSSCRENVQLLERHVVDYLFSLGSSCRGHVQLLEHREVSQRCKGGSSCRESVQLLELGYQPQERQKSSCRENVQLG